MAKIVRTKPFEWYSDPFVPTGMSYEVVDEEDIKKEAIEFNIRSEEEYRKNHKQVYIIAGTFYQAEAHAKERNLPRTNWLFINNPSGLQAINLQDGDEVVWTGSYHLRNDFNELQRMVNILTQHSKGYLTTYGPSSSDPLNMDMIHVFRE